MLAIGERIVDRCHAVAYRYSIIMKAKWPFIRLHSSTLKQMADPKKWREIFEYNFINQKMRYISIRKCWIAADFTQKWDLSTKSLIHKKRDNQFNSPKHFSNWRWLCSKLFKNRICTIEISMSLLLTVFPLLFREILRHCPPKPPFRLLNNSKYNRQSHRKNQVHACDPW